VCSSDLTHSVCLSVSNSRKKSRKSRTDGVEKILAIT